VALPNKEAEKATEHARCLVHEPGTVLASPDAFSRQNDIMTVELQVPIGLKKTWH